MSPFEAARQVLWVLYFQFMLHLGHIFSEMSNDLLDCFPEPFLPHVLSGPIYIPWAGEIAGNIDQLHSFSATTFCFAFCILNYLFWISKGLKWGKWYQSWVSPFDLLLSQKSCLFLAFWSLWIVSLRSSSSSSFLQHSGWGEMAVLPVLEADIATNTIF